MVPAKKQKAITRDNNEMRLHDIALKHGIKRKDTCKLFWGMYPYSLKTMTPSVVVDERRTAHLAFWNTNSATRNINYNRTWKELKPTYKEIGDICAAKINSYIDKIVSDNVDTFDADTFYYQYNDNTISFYLKTNEVTEALISNNPNLFTHYSSPRNVEVENFLLKSGDRRIEVRETAYYGMYNYRIAFKWAVDYTDLDSRIDNLCLDDNVYVGYHNRILYVKGDDDMFLVKLALDERINTLTKCFLIDQL